MTVNASFWAAALVLVGLAWALLWAGQRRIGVAPTPGRLNAALIDEALAAVDAEHAAGRLDAVAHREGVLGLQRRWLAESGAAAASPSASHAPSPRLLGGLGVALPVFVIGGYLLLGNPAGLHVETPAPPADEVSQADVERMVDTLARRLEAAPGGRTEDLPGWVMLARSQAALQRFDAAAAAYERAIALAPDDAQLLADAADVFMTLHPPAGSSDGSRPAADPSAAAGAVRPAAGTDRAAALVERALALDPRNPKALALAGNLAFDRRDTGAAIAAWRRARELAPAGSEFANVLDRNLADAGAAPPDTAAPAADNRVAGATRGAAAPVASGPGRSVVATIRVAPALAGRIGPTDTLFVFARVVGGPRMPLAIVRRPAATLPGSFTLDDTMAMSPELRLSNFGAVVVEARISPSGDAMPQPGDLIGEGRVDAGNGRLDVVIDRLRP